MLASVAKILKKSNFNVFPEKGRSEREMLGLGKSNLSTFSSPEKNSLTQCHWFVALA
jgi:hypothetical protein